MTFWQLDTKIRERPFWICKTSTPSTVDLLSQITLKLAISPTPIYVTYLPEMLNSMCDDFSFQETVNLRRKRRISVKLGQWWSRTTTSPASQRWPFSRCAISPPPRVKFLQASVREAKRGKNVEHLLRERQQILAGKMTEKITSSLRTQVFRIFCEYSFVYALLKWSNARTKRAGYEIIHKNSVFTLHSVF